MQRSIYDFQSEVCKAFSNPHRLQIINLLKANELAVSDIVKALKTTKANVSQHLSVMRLRGLLRTRREGTAIYYRIANKKLAHACSLMQDALGQIMDGNQDGRVSIRRRQRAG